MPKKELDRVDYEILHHLQNDARITNAELADRVCLSPSPCLVSLRFVVYVLAIYSLHVASFLSLDFSAFGTIPFVKIPGIPEK